MKRVRVDSVPAGTRVLWRGEWWTVGPRVSGEVLITHVQFTHMTAWLDDVERVSVELHAPDTLTPDECKALGSVLYAAYHFGSRNPAGVDAELDATIARLSDTLATYRARGLPVDSTQARIDLLVSLRGKLERRRALRVAS